MTVDEAADCLRQLLVDSGFDPTAPNPGVAWEAFKRFAAVPVDVHTVGFWFEAADGDLDSESPAYFDFVRMFMHYPEDGAEWGEQITAAFRATGGLQIGLSRSSVQAEDYSDLQAWFQAVESSAPFRAGSRFDGWSFEVRIDGC